MRPRVYICGPMTDMPEENRPAFRAAATLLRSHGFAVVSADELDHLHPPDEKTWAGYLRRDLPYAINSTMLVMLPGWRSSKGASLEAVNAAQFGIPAFELVNDSLRAIPPEHMPRIVHPV